MSWLDHAICKGVPPETFFPTKIGGRGYVEASSYVEAKKICEQCPVMLPCRKDALAHEHVEGFRGGLTPNELKELLKNEARPSECVICGLRFVTPQSTTRLYCSRQCKNTAEYRRRKLKLLTTAREILP